MATTLEDFPVELLEHIFSFVHSSNEIIALSETCILFHEVILSSEKLLSFLKIVINYTEDNLGIFSKTMALSRRRYRNIKILKTNERQNGYNNHTRSPRYFSKIAQNIRHLELVQSSSRNARENTLFEFVMNRRQRLDFNQHDRIQHAHRQGRDRNDSISELITVLREFNNLVSMKWNNVHLERNPLSHEKILHLSTVEELEMKHCDPHCFELMSSIQRLKKFKFSDPFWSSSRNPGIESLENFLVHQTATLKNLTVHNIQYPRLFQIDRSTNIIFKLHSLSLKYVFFKDSNFAEKFFRTQDELRNFEFIIQNEKVRSLDEVLFYNNILKLGKNS